jgi:hypothetical protein
MGKMNEIIFWLGVGFMGWMCVYFLFDLLSYLHEQGIPLKLIMNLG